DSATVAGSKPGSPGRGSADFLPLVGASVTSGSSGILAVATRLSRSIKPAIFFCPTPGVAHRSSNGVVRMSRIVRPMNANGRRRSLGTVQNAKGLSKHSAGLSLSSLSRTCSKRDSSLKSMTDCVRFNFMALLVFIVRPPPRGKDHAGRLPKSQTLKDDVLTGRSGARKRPGLRARHQAIGTVQVGKTWFAGLFR